MLFDNHKQYITGSDHFLIAMDYRMRKEGSAGNICRIAARLDGVLTAKQLDDKLSRIPCLNAISRIRIQRKVPFSIPYWQYRDRGELLMVAEHSVPETSERIKLEEVYSTLSYRLSGSRVIGFDLFAYADRKTDFLMSWHHGIMDIKGGLAIFSQLDEGYTDDLACIAEPAEEKQSVMEKMKQLPSTLLHARKSLVYIDHVSKAPMVSFHSKANGGEAAKDRYTLVRFNQRQTRQIEQCCQRIASGYKKSVFSLATVVRAIHAAVQSGKPGGEYAYVVPCPQNIRRKGGRTAILSNHVSFLFYRIEPKDLTDLRSAISSLSEQFMHQVKQQIPQSFRTAMDFFRRMPVCLYSGVLYGPSKGKLASFFFSDLGPLPQLNCIVDLAVLDLVVPAPVPTTPGLAVACWSFQDMLNICFSYSKNTFTQEESRRIEERLVDELMREQN